ncbi:MAG: DNA polymerase III subunit delta' [Kineosporiaceae bacterium]
MSVWDAVVGQQRAVALLRRAVTRQHEAPGLAHAWLVTGPPGSGRSVAARAFAAALQCPDGGCGRCPQCRETLAGAHPDVTVLATDEMQLRKDTVVGLIRRANAAPARGRRTVVIVEDADRLQDVGATMLLKEIEEPPPRTVWVLCAPFPEDLLPTIRSRCRLVTLGIPSPAAVVEFLVTRTGVGAAEAGWAAAASQGHIGVARRLAVDHDARRRRRDVLRLPSSLTGVPDAVQAASDLREIATEDAAAETERVHEAEQADWLHAMGVESADQLPRQLRTQWKDLLTSQKRRARRSVTDGLDRALLDLTGLYRDVLAVQFGASVPLVNADLRAEVEELAARHDPAAVLLAVDAISRTRTRLTQNAALPLALEALAVRMVPA